MEAHLAEEVVVSKLDVDRIERAVKKGGKREQVFPRLGELAADVAGDGLLITVRFSKSAGTPVRLVHADDDIEAAAIREVDLQRKFHWSKPSLAEKLALTAPKCLALRRYLEVEDDDDCRHEFVFGSQIHRQYSDNAYQRMRKALDGGLDMNEVWRCCRPGGPGRPKSRAASTVA